jgi:hypothetical protein
LSEDGDRKQDGQVEVYPQIPRFSASVVIRPPNALSRKHLPTPTATHVVLTEIGLTDASPADA